MEMTAFNEIYSKNDGVEKSDMPADAIISLDLAIECAKQFFETHEKPICIEWRDL